MAKRKENFPNMKKNTMMRIASILLVAVLLSTCTISGTFAKYVTEGSSTDSARVAMFGVEVSADFVNLFKSAYATTTAWTGDDGVSVKSIFGGDVVAPGTNGDLADFTVTGTPEVDVNVSYEADLKLENWIAKGAEYCPIVFTVNGTSYCIDGSAIKTVAELEAAVENAIISSAANYNAGTNLAAAAGTADDLAVSWKWHFMGSGEAGGTGPSTQWDEYDTALGNWHLNGAKAPQITLDVKCIVTQID
jgi:hypothetical protein